MYGSRYMGYNYSPLDNRLEQTMKSSSAKKASTKNGNGINVSNTASPVNQNQIGSNKSESSNCLTAKDLTTSMPHSMSVSQLSQNNRKSSAQATTPHALLTFKNNLFGELTRAIQSVIMAILKSAYLASFDCSSIPPPPPLNFNGSRVIINRFSSQ